MKKTLCFSMIFILFAAIGCNNGATSTTTSELEQKKEELEKLRSEIKTEQEKQKIDDEMAQLEAELKRVKGEKAPEGTPTIVKQKTPSNASMGMINAGAVVMRGGPSTSDAKVDNFNQNELVTILESRRPENANEAILRKEMKLYATSDMSGTQYYPVPKGKAVKIESTENLNDGDIENSFNVSYKHPQHGTIYATVNESDIDFISNEIWYRVKRTNGKTGWVFGKFLTKQ
jgi:hypothetical protein